MPLNLFHIAKTILRFSYYKRTLPYENPSILYHLVELFFPGMTLDQIETENAENTKFSKAFYSWFSRVATDKTTRNLDFWPRVVSGEATEEEWRHFIREERLSASVDFPTSLFWKDLVKMFPNAKVGGFLKEDLKL